MSTELDSKASAKNKAGTTLLDQVMKETRMNPDDDGFETARRGVEAFISDLVSSDQKIEKVEKKLVDDMIAVIDEKNQYAVG